MTRIAMAMAMSMAACTGGPPVATAADASRAQVELAELQQGRTLMIRKCGNCHAPPHPGDEVRADWPTKLDEMALRSNLDAGQRRLIQQYFVVMAPR